MIGTALYALGVIACMVLIVLAVLVTILFFAQLIGGLGRFVGVLLVVSAVVLGAAYLLEGVIYFVPEWLSNWFLSLVSKLPHLTRLWGQGGTFKTALAILAILAFSEGNLAEQ